MSSYEEMLKRISEQVEESKADGVQKPETNLYEETLRRIAKRNQEARAELRDIGTGLTESIVRGTREEFAAKYNELFDELGIQEEDRIVLGKDGEAESTGGDDSGAAT